MADLTQGQPVSNNPTEPVATEPAAAGTTTETTNGIAEGQSGQVTEQAQGAPAEEQFTDLDPNTLSPELQATYKQLQAAFTKKTQGVAELKKKAEIYDQLAADEEVLQFLDQRSRRGQEATGKPEQQQPLVTEEEYAEALSGPQGFANVFQKLLTKAIQPLQQKVREAEAADIIEEFASAGHEDIYNLQEDELISIQLRLDPPRNEADYRKKVEEAYQRAKVLTDKYYQKGYEKAKAEMSGVIQNKVNASSQPPTINPGKTYEGPDPKTLTGAEAFRLAKRGQRVPQN